MNGEHKQIIVSTIMNQIKSSNLALLSTKISKEIIAAIDLLDDKQPSVAYFVRIAGVSYYPNYDGQVYKAHEITLSKESTQRCELYHNEILIVKSRNRRIEQYIKGILNNCVNMNDFIWVFKKYFDISLAFRIRHYLLGEATSTVVKTEEDFKPILTQGLHECFKEIEIDKLLTDA